MSSSSPNQPHREQRAPDAGATGDDRRRFLAKASGLAMAGGLAAGYGAAGVIAARYLFPAHSGESEWVFLATLDQLREGAALVYRSPSGEKITVARRGAGSRPEDFVALSSTCPHLGCQVHWEPQNERFFCPCHNGTFDPSGAATGGPPAEAGQSLPTFPLKLEGELLYIRVPREALRSATGERIAALAPCREGSPPGPGHDPCLYPRGDTAS